MPPIWKIRRELNRLAFEPFRWTKEAGQRLYLRRYYDLVQSRQIRLSAGALDLGQEACIYLIFPTKGVLPSHVRALRTLVDAGITPVAVSNLPLSDNDRELLYPLTMQVIERPNVGYDFGGYRDGVLELAERLPALNRLWLMNDSTWLIPQPTNWFEDARKLNVDFVGATSNFAMPRVDPERFRDISWTFSNTHRNFHYASYALGIGSRILSDDDFLDFWKKLEIRNDKSRTVRRGEIGLTQFVLKKGFRHAATHEVDKLHTELAELDDLEIDQITQDLVIPPSTRLEEQRRSVLNSDPSSPEGRKDREAFILTAVSRHAAGYVLPAYTVKYRGFQFLKKSPVGSSDEAARTMRAIIARIGGDAGAEIAAEAQLISS